jgi:L-threonylcarbamoyladenylate synthase
VIDEVVAAMQAGEPVVLPTDTVYGLCADASREEAVRRLYRLKGRDDVQPTALIAADAPALRALVPELSGQPLLRGPYTLILRNPARRLPWLTGERPDTIGVRLPSLAGDALAVVRRVGAVAATSANRPGEPDPRSVDEIPEEFLATCPVVDGGVVRGTPSTVIDLTGDEPVVLREGAVPADEALSAVQAVRRD